MWQIILIVALCGISIQAQQYSNGQSSSYSGSSSSGTGSSSTGTGSGTSSCSISDLNNSQQPHYRIVGVPADLFLIINSGSSQPYSGFIWDLLTLLSSTANFTFSFYTVPVGQYGELQPNGSYNGLLGELLKGNADVAAADFSIQTDREHLIDYTVPFYEFNLELLYNTQTGLNNVQYLALDSIDAQYIRQSPHNGSTIYANLIADPNSFIASQDQAVQMVLNGGFAYFLSTPNIDVVIDQNNGRLAKTTNVYNTGYFAFGLPNNSPARTRLNIGLTTLQQTGQLTMLINKWLT